MKAHMNFRTAHLEESVAFYGALLAQKPTKQFKDYALFVTEEPRLELALDADEAVTVDSCAHYGIVVDTPKAVEDAIEQLRSAGLELDIEREETCCYARQDKVWVTDPDGRRWEVYTVLEETGARDAAAASSGCCTA
ncbi:MAG: ArsI/CadI family heavy metal resistance metalloenzyme [Candidatus Baltobacteraceae bacterium]